MSGRAVAALRVNPEVITTSPPSSLDSGSNFFARVFLKCSPQMRFLNGESRRSNARAPRAQRRRLLEQSGDDDGAKLDYTRLHEVEVWKFGGWSTIIYMVEKDDRKFWQHLP